MKNIIFVLSLFLTAPVFSQTYFGIKAFADVSHNRWAGKSRVSPSGGIFLQEDINKHLSLRQEALLSFDGYSIKKHFTDVTRPYIYGYKRVEYQINSIELPCLAFYKVGNKVKPYIGGGASVKFNILSRTRIATNDEFFFEDYKSSGFDFSLISAIGIETNIKENPIHFELRYNHGLIEVVNEQKFSSLYFILGFKI